MAATRIYDVPSISCGHCKASIEEAVGALDDVERVLVDIDARTVAVDGEATDATVEAAIDEAGYEVVGRHDI